MTEAQITPFDHPAAWKATDFASKDALAIDLDRRHLDALTAAAARLKGATADFSAVTPSGLPARRHRG